MALAVDTKAMCESVLASHSSPANVWFSDIETKGLSGSCSDQRWQGGQYDNCARTFVLCRQVVPIALMIIEHDVWATVLADQRPSVQNFPRLREPIAVHGQAWAVVLDLD